MVLKLVSIALTAFLVSCVTVENCDKETCLKKGSELEKSRKTESAHTFFDKGCKTMGASGCLAVASKETDRNVMRAIVRSACKMDDKACIKVLPIEKVLRNSWVPNNKADIFPATVAEVLASTKYPSWSESAEENEEDCLKQKVAESCLIYFSRQKPSFLSQITISRDRTRLEVIDAALDRTIATIEKLCTEKKELAGFNACKIKSSLMPIFTSRASKIEEVKSHWNKQKEDEKVEERLEDQAKDSDEDKADQ